MVSSPALNTPPPALSRLGSYAKFLDQPVMLEGFRRSVPTALPAVGLGFLAYDTLTAPEGERGKTFVKSAAVIGGTVLAALYAMRRYMKPDPVLLKEAGEEALQFLKNNADELPEALAKGLAAVEKPGDLLNVMRAAGVESTERLKSLVTQSAEAVGLDPLQAHALKVETLTQFLKSRGLGEETPLMQLLNLAKESTLSPGKVHQIRELIAQVEPDPEKAQKLVSAIIPDPENLTGKELMGEIWDLSMMGLFPVLGGLLGGVAGNVLTGRPVVEKFKDQAKEGFFQYFANIVLCNIGAGLCLFALEKTPLKNSRPARFASMVAGITAFGIVGGSAIANFFGKNLINPMIDDGPVSALKDLGSNIARGNVTELFSGLYDERTPEPIDVGLHIDDVATVGVLSGLKWIEPALPFLYSISGFRTGIGYRNNASAQASDNQTVRSSLYPPGVCPPVIRHNPLFKELYLAGQRSYLA